MKKQINKSVFRIAIGFFMKTNSYYSNKL